MKVLGYRKTEYMIDTYLKDIFNQRGLPTDILDVSLIRYILSYKLHGVYTANGFAIWTCITCIPPIIECEMCSCPRCGACSYACAGECLCEGCNQLQYHCTCKCSVCNQIENCICECTKCNNNEGDGTSWRLELLD